MKIDLSSKRAQAVLFVVSLAFATWAVFGMAELIQTQRTRKVFEAIGHANAERQKQGESLKAAESYVAALRAIDTKYTTKELKLAFAAYVTGFEEGIALLKAGKDSASADAKITAAHRELVEIAKRY